MSTKLFYLFAITLLLFSCGGEDQNEEKDVINAVGGVRYGGEFKFMSKEKVNNLFPLNVTDVYASRITTQIFEGLLKIDPSSMKVIPCIAKDYEVSDDSKTFTFNLRDDVYFHDNDCFEDGKGRLVTANDFKYSLEMACSSSKLNKLSWLLTDKIVGAQAYFNKKSDEVTGIKVIDESTLEIELINPFSSFHKLITHYGLVVFPREAIEHYGDNIVGNPVGTGAFMLDELADDKITLKRNTNYWRKDDFGNQLPFLDKIEMTYSKNKADELLSFRSQEIDLVLDIPVEEIDNVLGTLTEAQEGKNVKHKVDSKSSISIQYFAFNHESEVFSKREVRKAFNLAIDREAIIETWLEGEGWAANYGFVPKMKNYPYKSIKGYSLQIEKAKELMKKAGYPEGKNFPQIQLYVNAAENSGTHKLAKAVVFSLKQNLGIKIKIKLCSIKEREEAIKSGKAVFWRTGWIADYPDPENFLNLFYVGKDKEIDKDLNPFNYSSKKFDQLFEKAMAETDDSKRMEILAQCDQIIIDDAVVMPLLTEDFITMINLKVKGFNSNEMEQLDFSSIYIREIRQ